MEPYASTVRELYDAAQLSRLTRNRGWKSPLTAFTPRVSVADICKEVLGDAELLRAMAARSYRHPNGFDKLILLRDERGALIKFDVWWEGDTDWGRIHDHRFDFSSIVLSGSLQLRHYLPAKLPDAQCVDVYRLSVPQQESDLIPRRQGLITVWEGVVPAGTHYDMDCNMFHQATGIGDRITVTLVIQGASRKPYSRVVSDGQFLVKVMPFTPEELEDKLLRLASL
jgi:hypothetical protein